MCIWSCCIIQPGIVVFFFMRIMLCDHRCEKNAKMSNVKNYKILFALIFFLSIFNEVLSTAYVVNSAYIRELFLNRVVIRLCVHILRIILFSLLGLFIYFFFFNIFVITYILLSTKFVKFNRHV